MTRLFALACVLSACSGVPASSGREEPIRIREGAYRRGSLPGVDGDGSGVVDEPFVAGVDTPNLVIAIGQAGKSFVGRVSTSAVTVAIGFLDVGGSHYVVPVGGPDPSNPGEYGFTATADFGRDLAPGLHRLGFVAIDAQGHAGTRSTFVVCVQPDVPDNGFSCDPATFVPPNTAISLAWNDDVDLDLIVETPSGKLVSGKRPTTVLVDGGAIPTPMVNDPSTGTFTRDSNADCVADGTRRESLVFQGPPPPGIYRVYVNLNRACGHASTTFRVSTYRSTGDADGGIALERADLAVGTVLAVQANGGTGLGTHVLDLSVP